MNKKIIVTLHASFVGGSHTWDQKQTNCLQKLGFEVHQLDFPKDNLEETLLFIKHYIDHLLKEKEQEKVYILGRSSGGALAKLMFDQHPELFYKAIYLAPVFNPEIRGQINTKFYDKQEHFFRLSGYPETNTFDNEKEILILASHDENVPQECFTEEQISCALDFNIRTHKGVCETTLNT